MNGAGWSGLDGGRVSRLRRRLRAWYRRNRRALPWRERPDPYRVLVSELMLQQTRVSTMLPYYRRFLERFPTVEHLARARPDDVLAAWSGLGYYRRARYLHEAAGRITSRREVGFPREVRELRELPGVGRYTAAAVASIAFGEPEPAVDGNASRVLARLAGIDSDVKSGRGARLCWEVAARLLDREHPGEFNQAVMELGAMVCTPVRPDCPRCPWRRDCRAQAEGRQEELPAPTPRAPSVSCRAAVAVLRRGGRCLLVRRGGTGQLEGMWEFPGDGGGGDPRHLGEALRRRHRLWAEVGASLGAVRHSILDRRFRLEMFRARLLRPPRRTAGPDGWRWIRPDHALQGGLPLSAAARKVLSQLRRRSP